VAFCSDAVVICLNVYLPKLFLKSFQHMPNVVIRVDASTDIGTGHVMRCLTLAHALKRRGANVSFVCADLPGHRIDHIQACGFETHAIQANAETIRDAQQTMMCIGDDQPDWLVLDHYGLSEDWQATLRCQVQRLMVIDDLERREHNCDLLVDPGLERGADAYAQTQARGAELLLGPSYALLRSEFAQLRSAALQRRLQTEPQQLMVSFGGVDAMNFTTGALKALREQGWHQRADIVVILGAQAPHRAEVAQTVQTMGARVRLLLEVTDMARQMAESDVAIGAPGTSSWERCCLGLPAVLVVQADNQRHNAQTLAQHHAAVWVPQTDQVAAGLAEICVDLKSFSESAARLCDGQGVDRVVAAMLEGRP
jgi:UDP-2,4-diacetamido-2,4,6-trideoxy-beta-L-altropyranose hydrolase